MTIIHLAVTAALALFAPPPLASAVSDLTVIRNVPGSPPPRYVRLRLDVTAYGIPGRGEILVDRTSGRFVRRFDAGPVSEREGWDGVRPWRTDASGMPRVEGNVDERGVIRAWSRLLAAPSDARCDCGSRAPEVTADPATGRPASVALHVGEQTVHVTFGDYRRAGALLVPFLLVATSANGTWSARVRAVETPSAVAHDAFAPPPAPHDATLHGVTSVALTAGLPVPVVPVTVNGAALHFLLDTGGQNAITPAAAERAGLHVVGAGTVGGAGAGLAKVQFATARVLRVGGAELRAQPFIVLDLPGSGLDGIIGYELLARFAARLDLANDTVELAADARAFAGSGVAVPMTFDDRQPQVDGALDGIPATITIDTGSVSSADVNTPFVHAHDLVARYHATASGYPIVGLGGPVRAFYARADELRLGELRVRDVPLLLTEATAGAESNPTVAINVGDQVLRRYTLVLDYRAGTLRFDPPSRR